MSKSKIALGVLAGLVAIYIALCSMGAKMIDVTRSTSIDAPVDIIYSNVIDIAKWKRWGTWYEQDPSMKLTYSENTVGVGAKNSWESEKLGNGSQEIVEVIPNQLIKTRMQFDDWEGFSFADIRLERINYNQTKVIWTLKGDSEIPFLGRGMMILMGFEKSIMDDYDSGLARLKALSEQMAREMPMSAKM